MEFYGYIYKITLPEGAFNKNGKPFYIGQKKGSKIKESYYGSGTMMVHYIKKHGTQELQREILDWAVSQEQLNQLEYEYIHPHFETELCLNLKEGGRQAEMSAESRLKMSISQKNRKPVSEETRQKLSKAGKGRIISDEHRKKLSEAQKGKKHSEESRLKMSKALKGRIISDEYRQKINKNRIGIPRSEETRRKISEGQKNRKPISEETRKKMSEAQKGHHHSEEAKRKIGEFNKGKIVSEETRRKMKENHFRRHSENIENK
jgi:hypothetical protein